MEEFDAEKELKNTVDELADLIADGVEQKEGEKTPLKLEQRKEAIRQQVKESMGELHERLIRGYEVLVKEINRDGSKRD